MTRGPAVRVAAVLLVGAFVALLLYGVLAKAPDTGVDDALDAGTAIRAPEFDDEILVGGSMPALLAQPFERAAADGRLRLSELRGRPVVLNLWASWCTPCADEAPVLERGWRRAGRSGVLFLGVDMQDIREDARKFVRKFGLTYPSVREPSRQTAIRYGATGYPETYFISRRGDIVGHVIGVVSAGQLGAGIEAARTARPRVLGTGGSLEAAR